MDSTAQPRCEEDDVHRPDPDRPAGRLTPGMLRTLWLVATVGLVLAIGVLTLSPMPNMPRGPGQLDKLAHMLAFFALVLPTALFWPRWMASVGLLGVLYGAVIEVVQPYAGRSAELADLFADGIGVGLGLIVGAGLRRWIVSRRAVAPVRVE